MKLTNEGIKDGRDSADITGAIASHARAESLLAGWTLGQVTRGEHLMGGKPDESATPARVGGQLLVGREVMFDNATEQQITPQQEVESPLADVLPFGGGAPVPAEIMPMTALGGRDIETIDVKDQRVG